MAGIELRGLTKSFAGQDVIRGVSLTVAAGEFCVIVGPSGCGKSTLLRLIAGLEDASAGSIAIGGRDVTRLDPWDRGLAMVFQSYALYPHMSVRDNMAFGLRTARVAKAEVARKVDQAARMLRLEGLLDRRPAALSGGQRQRVAIGRAIVRDPAAFLFDEPLSNLDASLRADTRVELAALHRALGATMVYVTHDQVEAMTMADRIVVLDGGRVRQQGSPRDLYERPADTFVAQFLGSPRMTLIPVDVQDGQVVLPGGGRLSAPWAGVAQVGLRAEHARITAPGGGVLSGEVVAAEYLGATLSVLVRVADGLTVAALAPPHQRVTPGEGVGIAIAAADLHPFGADGRRIDG
ncbi:MAG: ATP-binding cassette domain-containing protein [Rhodobacteraceae bacterium]|nr:ATP-binding cassette domain-containing protein [Paracoccaceae bacterium]